MKAFKRGQYIKYINFTHKKFLLEHGLSRGISIGAETSLIEDDLHTYPYLQFDGKELSDHKGEGDFLISTDEFL